MYVIHTMTIALRLQPFEFNHMDELVLTEGIR